MQSLGSVEPPGQAPCGQLPQEPLTYSLCPSRTQVSSHAVSQQYESVAHTMLAQEGFSQLGLGWSSQQVPGVIVASGVGVGVRVGVCVGLAVAVGVVVAVAV